MCTVLLPSGVNEIAVNKYIISYHIKVAKKKEKRQINVGRNGKMEDRKTYF